jgi:hypothetical protein
MACAAKQLSNKPAKRRSEILLCRCSCVSLPFAVQPNLFRAKQGGAVKWVAGLRYDKLVVTFVPYCAFAYFNEKVMLALALVAIPGGHACNLGHVAVHGVFVAQQAMLKRCVPGFANSCHYSKSPFSSLGTYGLPVGFCIAEFVPARFNSVFIRLFLPSGFIFAAHSRASQPAHAGSGPPSAMRLQLLRCGASFGRPPSRPLFALERALARLLTPAVAAPPFAAKQDGQTSLVFVWIVQ